MKKLTKAAKHRIAIAKDALTQLNAKRYRAITGIYIQTSHEDSSYDVKTMANKAFFNNPKMPPCDVCAKGALICSIIKKHSRFHGSIEVLGFRVEEVMSRFFTASQAELIEWAFECWSYDGADRIENSEELLNKAERFGNRYITAKGRLRGILRNIIANKGEFVP